MRGAACRSRQYLRRSTYLRQAGAQLSRAAHRQRGVAGGREPRCRPDVCTVGRALPEAGPVPAAGRARRRRHAGGGAGARRRLAFRFPLRVRADGGTAGAAWLFGGGDQLPPVGRGALSGGQIASLAGVTGHLDQFDPGAAGSAVSSAVQAIVNIDGLSDFTAEAALKYEDDPAKQPSAAGAWFGGRYAEKAALWAEASPIRYVRPGMPPILFIASAQPRFSVGREAMAARMTQAGVANRTLVLPDTPHSFWLFDPWLQTTVEATLAFLNQQMPQR